MLKPTNYILRLPESGLFVSANHYSTVPSQPEGSEPQFAAGNGLTLVFAHCSSARTSALYLKLALLANS